jgi:hypothetical protein
MIVRCKTSVIEEIEDARLRAHVREHVHLAEVDLKVGHCYPVLGVLFRDGVPWFLVCEDPEDEFPKTHCSALFDIEEGSIPDGWQLRLGPSNVGNNALLPAEWAEDGQFLEKLVDGDAEAGRVFQAIKCRYGVGVNGKVSE